MNRNQIDRRINLVTEYRGSQDLVVMIARTLPSKAISGVEPSWVLTQACMLPEEYMVWGREGKAWKFLQGKFDTAQNCINVHRQLVEKYASQLGLKCDWNAISRYDAAA